MNLWNKFIVYIFGEKLIPFGEKLIPFDEFTKQLNAKLVEYGYKRDYNIIIKYKIFYYGTIAYDFFIIDPVNEVVHFVNNENDNPVGGWTSFGKENFTKTNLNFLFEKASLYAKLSKKCMIQAKLDEIGKDFE